MLWFYTPCCSADKHSAVKTQKQKECCSLLLLIKQFCNSGSFSPFNALYHRWPTFSSVNVKLSPSINRPLTKHFIQKKKKQTDSSNVYLFISVSWSKKFYFIPLWCIVCLAVLVSTLISLQFFIKHGENRIIMISAEPLLRTAWRFRITKNTTKMWILNTTQLAYCSKKIQ